MPLHKQLFAYALSLLKNESDAADCLQEAMTRLWENRARLEELENPEAYATVTVRNIAITVLARRRRNNAIQSDAPPDITDSGPDPFDKIDLNDRLKVVNELIRQLPENQRRVLVMSSVNGLSNNEIHRITGLSDENVRVSLSRGRRKIRNLFEKIFKEG